MLKKDLHLLVLCGLFRFQWLKEVPGPGGTGARLPFRWPGRETGKKSILFTVPPCPVDAVHSGGRTHVGACGSAVVTDALPAAIAVISLPLGQRGGGKFHENTADRRDRRRHRPGRPGRPRFARFPLKIRPLTMGSMTSAP